MSECLRAEFGERALPAKVGYPGHAICVAMCVAAVNHAIELGDGASIRLAIDGFARGAQYGAFDHKAACC